MYSWISKRLSEYNPETIFQLYLFYKTLYTSYIILFLHKPAHRFFMMHDLEFVQTHILITLTGSEREYVCSLYNFL